MNEDSKYEGKDDEEEIRYKKNSKKQNSLEEEFLIETMIRVCYPMSTVVT